MKRELKYDKGITLIALVITIIVLLVLAGVTLSMISSQDGILNKAVTAKEATEKAKEKENEININIKSHIQPGTFSIYNWIKR